MVNLKQNNIITILNILRENGPMSRKEIAHRVKLTRASITQLTNQLIKKGIIYEVGELEEEVKKVGRKEILINLDYNYGYIIGIAVEIDKTYIAITNLSCKVLCSSSFNFDSLTTKTQEYTVFKNILIKEIKKLLICSEIQPDKLIGTGLVCISRKKEKQSTYAILDKKATLIKDLEKTFKIPCLLENNVRALAIAETLFYNTENLNSYLFIKIGPGIGGAIVLNNNLYVGDSNKTGEIGRSIQLDLNTELNYNTNVLTVENMMSKKYIIQCIKPYFNKNDMPNLFEIAEGDINKVSTNHIYNLLNDEDPKITHIYENSMKILAVSIYNAYILLGLNKIVIYYTMPELKILDSYLKKFLKILDEELFENITTSNISVKQPFIGAVAIVAKNFYLKEPPL